MSQKGELKNVVIKFISQSQITGSDSLGNTACLSPHGGEEIDYILSHTPWQAPYWTFFWLGGGMVSVILP